MMQVPEEFCRFAFKTRLLAFHDETFPLGVPSECRKKHLSTSGVSVQYFNAARSGMARAAAATGRDESVSE
jgi:hypothetical protein